MITNLKDLIENLRDRAEILRVEARLLNSHYELEAKRKEYCIHRANGLEKFATWIDNLAVADKREAQEIFDDDTLDCTNKVRKLNQLFAYIKRREAGYYNDIYS